MNKPLTRNLKQMKEDFRVFKAKILNKSLTLTRQKIHCPTNTILSTAQKDKGKTNERVPVRLPEI